MIPHPTPLHDIGCVESFVAACMVRSRVRFPEHEREEMLAEGIALLYELAGEYQPQMAGYEREGSFAGYASFLLPKRMQSAWHALHPEHLARREEDGRRVYDYAPPAISLHAEDAPAMVGTMVLHAVPEDHSPHATGIRVVYEPPGSVASALARLPAEYRIGRVDLQVTQMVEQGYGTDEIASRVRLNRSDVGLIRSAIASGIAEVRHMEAA